jgi:hypothetical protein
LLPLAVIGLVTGLRWRRDPPHRTVLIALFTAPLGAALAGLAVARSLVLVVPSTLLTAVGEAMLVHSVSGRAPYSWWAASRFVLPSRIGVGMVWDALSNGPTWYADDGLSGMQYGAREAFSATSDHLAKQTEAQAQVLTSAWNGSDMLRRLFAKHTDRISLLNLVRFKEERFTHLESAMVVMTAADCARVTQSVKFPVEAAEPTLLPPDRRSGFRPVHPGCAASAGAISAAEREARRAMIEEEAEWDDQTVSVRHRAFVHGSPGNPFGIDTSTFVRNSGINPAVLEVESGVPIRYPGLRPTTWHSDTPTGLKIDPGGDIQPGRYEHRFTGLPADSTLGLQLDPPLGPTSRLTNEVHDMQGPTTSHVHLREIDLLE